MVSFTLSGCRPTAQEPARAMLLLAARGSPAIAIQAPDIRNSEDRTSVSLDWLPKVISEMVGQTCRFAAAPSRAPPTISEMTFGNHSNHLRTGLKPRIALIARMRNGALIYPCHPRNPWSNPLRRYCRCYKGADCQSASPALITGVPFVARARGLVSLLAHRAVPAAALRGPRSPAKKASPIPSSY